MASRFYFERAVLIWLEKTDRRIAKSIFMKNDDGSYKQSWVDSAWIGWQLSRGEL